MDDNRKFPRRSVLRGAVLLATAALAVRVIPTKEALAQALLHQTEQILALALADLLIIVTRDAEDVAARHRQPA